MKPQIDVVIIYCMTGTAKKYVASASRRFDQKIVPQFTDEHLQAFRCEDDSHAAALIKDIHDSERKTYKTEWITVEKEPAVKYGSLVKGAMINT